MLNKVDAFGTSYSLHKINKKTPIVFVHGVGLTKEIWEPQIGFFKDYNTLTYDLLGHGKTSLKKSKVSFEDFAKQLLKLIDQLNNYVLNYLINWFDWLIGWMDGWMNEDE